MSFPEFPRSTREDESFYRQCRAAYLSVFKSSLANISSKQQLCCVLQQAGRNPSQACLNKYWTAGTSKLNFDDFCEILKNEKKTDENDLLKAFRKLDTNRDGYINHSALEKVLSNGGEKMTSDEIKAIFALADVNKDGKLDYTEFCRLFVSTVDQCQMAALERLEADSKLKKQNFGSQFYSPPKNSKEPAPSTESPAMESSRSDVDSTAKKESRSSSRPSSARSRRSSLSNVITMTASNSRISKVAEPPGLQNWQHNFAKGCFFVEEDGNITSLQYQLHIPRTTEVYLTIQPVTLRSRTEDKSDWMSTDTAIFVMTTCEIEGDSTLVCFTESKDKEKYVWRGELKAGTYYLLPFTTGCKFKKSNKKTSDKPKALVYTTDTGELDLSRELREVLCDIFDLIDLDGNGLLSLDEYNFFELRSSGEKCDKDAWSVCKENFDMRSNQLSRQGFMELTLMEATEKDGDSTDLWVTLQAMGYNHQLELLEACPFKIDIFCESAKPLVHPICLDSGTSLLQQAIHKSIIGKSLVKSLRGNDNVLIYTYKGEHRISSYILNKTNQKVTVRVNNEQSRNCCNSRDMTVFAVEISAHGQMVCQHVLPLNEKQDWMYSCIESIIPSNQ